jgi:hypothetical protein
VNKPYGLACAKAASGEQALAAAAVVTITKVFQIPCTGLAHCACVQAVVNMMCAVEQHLKSGHGMMCFLLQELAHRVKVWVGVQTDKWTKEIIGYKAVHGAADQKILAKVLAPAAQFILTCAIQFKLAGHVFQVGSWIGKQFVT